MPKQNTAIAWGPYRDWAEAKTWHSGSENLKPDHNNDEVNPGLWGPLFAAVEEKSNVLPGSVVARRALRTFLEFVDQMRSHEAPVRPPKPPLGGGSTFDLRRPWKPYRLAPEIGPGKVLLKKGRYQVLFLAGDPTSFLKLAELNDEANVRKGALVIDGQLSSLVRNDASAMEQEARVRTAGLNVVWGGHLQGYLSNKRSHVLRQQTPFEAVPEGLRTEHRSFSAMPKKLRRRLVAIPSDRVSESLRPQYLSYRRRLGELGLEHRYSNHRSAEC